MDALFKELEKAMSRKVALGEADVRLNLELAEQIYRILKPSTIVVEQNDRQKLIDTIAAIIESHTRVGDEWGGVKLANWKYRNSVWVEGYEDAAEAILDHLEKDLFANLTPRSTHTR